MWANYFIITFISLKKKPNSQKTITYKNKKKENIILYNESTIGKENQKSSAKWSASPSPTADTFCGAKWSKTWEFLLKSTFNFHIDSHFCYTAFGMPLADPPSRTRSPKSSRENQRHPQSENPPGFSSVFNNSESNFKPIDSRLSAMSRSRLTSSHLPRC